MDRPCRCTAPAQRTTVRCNLTQSSQSSDRRTIDLVPDGCLFTRSGTASEIVYELLDALGGCSTAGIGSNYRDGFELSQKLVD